MDPNVQGSFIPKQALAAQARGGGMSLILLLALVIFVISLAAAGAAFGYQQLLSKQINDKDTSLRRAEGAFDASAIQDLVRTDSRITQARSLLQKHISPSAIFYFLSTITLQSVQFSSFEYSLTQDGSASISLLGSADSFSSVALQSDQFGGSKVLKDVIFSGISVGDLGKITFNVGATVDPSLLLYSRNLSQQAAQSASSTTP